MLGARWCVALWERVCCDWGFELFYLSLFIGLDAYENGVP